MLDYYFFYHMPSSKGVDDLTCRCIHPLKFIDVGNKPELRLLVKNTHKPKHEKSCQQTPAKNISDNVIVNWVESCRTQDLLFCPGLVSVMKQWLLYPPYSVHRLRLTSKF